MYKQKASQSQRRKEKYEKKISERTEVSEVLARIRKETPASGHNPLDFEDAAVREIEPHHLASGKGQGKRKNVNGTYTPVSLTQVSKFSDLPLSTSTKKGLENNKFVHLTKVQRATLPHTLAGRDVVAEARTGSGKTLAYLIPVLECLWKNEFNPKDDKLGALVLCPTRELAIQVFDVLRKVGHKHKFSAGMIVGGKDFDEEQAMLSHINILVSTPGRLMHHMDTSYHLDCSNVKILVLDEADFILELGFEKQLEAIFENLPAERQTLLFSATMSTAIKKLVKLNMKKPEFLSIHNNDNSSMTSTPSSDQLDQRYLLVDAAEKVEMIYTFIKTHQYSKTIVFCNTCNEVEYLYRVYLKLRPNIKMYRLHAKLSPTTRLDLYYEFCNREAGVLFATDIAARGLDFPKIDWVLQADCPLTTDQYVHRVGRTARFQDSGKALLLLLPSEIKFIEKLAKLKVIVKEVSQKLKSKRDVTALLSGVIAEENSLKFLGQKCFISYIRSVYLAEDKEVFDITKVDGIGYAKSLGLPGVPIIKKLKESQSFLKNMSYEERDAYHKYELQKKLDKKRKKVAKELGIAESEVVLPEEVELKRQKEMQAKRKLLKDKRGQVDEIGLLMLRESTTLKRASRVVGEDEEEDDFLTITRRNHDIEGEELEEEADTYDNADQDFVSLLSELKAGKDADDEDDDNMISALKSRVKAADDEAKANIKLRVKEKRAREKEAKKKAIRKMMGEGDDDVAEYRLGGGDDDEDEDELEEESEQMESEEEEEESEEEIQQPIKKTKKADVKANVKANVKAIPQKKQRAEINLNESSDEE